MDCSQELLRPFNSNRRRLLKATSAIAVASIFPHVIHANTKGSSERTLGFVNLHTGEKLTSCYWANDHYDQNSLAEINHILRDHRAEESCEMSASLLDLLHTLHQMTSSKAPFHIISGYRSPKTNEKLRKQSNGVAKRSMHMRGMAIDVRLPDVELSRLRDAALTLQAGGVGYYAKSNFLHLDMGKPRSW